ncbi:MAG: tRNA pseudouridine(55) synthase TruB [Gammaproteobacteria bacterium]|nr:tRNA pseudouridine(55) synthase TruB [Gammaproteobacteria bacterium]
MIKRHYNDIHGVLLLDKPIGLSSNQALQAVKRLYAAKKAGHTGSLDPLATGMLPLCFGEATKFSQFLLESDKTYETRFKLGEMTTTGDAEGEIINTQQVSVSLKELSAVLKTFLGRISQVPSMYSALKYQGQPLYKLARQGIEVPRASREIDIFALDLLNFDSPFVSIRVHCSKGTYIRTLVEDIGKALGCGAHVTALRRLTAGPYQAEQMVSMAQLEESASQGLPALLERLLPIETLVKTFPVINLTSLTTLCLRRGQAVLIPHAPLEGWVQLNDKDGRFLGLGVVLSDGRIAPKRLVRDTGKVCL